MYFVIWREILAPKQKPAILYLPICFSIKSLGPKTYFLLFPRSHRYDKRPADSNLGLEGSLVGRSRHLGRDRLHSSAVNVVQRPRSLERSSNDLLELRRLQAMRSPPPNNVLSRLGNPAGKIKLKFFKKATKKFTKSPNRLEIYLLAYVLGSSSVDLLMCHSWNFEF